MRDIEKCYRLSMKKESKKSRYLKPKLKKILIMKVLSYIESLHLYIPFLCAFASRPEPVLYLKYGWFNLRCALCQIHTGF